MKSRGFTLIEVLVAVVIIATAGFTVSSAVGNVVSQTYSLERRTVAHWVASNQLNRIHMSRVNQTDPIPTSRNTERVLMGGREWKVETEFANTTHPWLRRVEIDVFEVSDKGDIGPIDHLIGFVGRY
ncbi:MAG: type II secretion system minor pseudopilin GspI [Proteobacteria bacterium]|nr:type II secretion system minor pseudopilin GspI [Pseudomonadota bacterium]